MKTTVFIAFQNKKNIFDHAGKCRNFLSYTITNNEIVSKQLVELTKEETIHEVFSLPVEEQSSKLFNTDILLTRGIGLGAIQKLSKHNIAAYIIKETDPDIAIEKLLNGTLKAYKPANSEKANCDGNGGCGCKNHDKHHHHH